METTAIQQDVETKEEEIVIGNTARNEIVESIAARARQERDEEIKRLGGEVVDTSGSKDESSEEEKEEVVETKEEAEDKKQEQEIKPETIKIKVDGEEKEVPKDKIYDAGIRALQKESAADKRLEEATRLLREIETKYAKPQEEQTASPSQEWDDKTVAYALEHGNEEQKAYAVSLLRGRATTTPDQLVNEATQRVLDTVDFQESSRKFITEYSDIANDPYLFKLAVIAENEARMNGDKRPRSELYKEIGDNLRKWKGGNVATDSMSEKKELKASKVVNIPSASMRKTTTETQKPKTTADIIEEMRKQRGQR